MRHVVGFLVGVIVAGPLILGFSWGSQRLAEIAPGAGIEPGRVFPPIGALLLCGVVVGVIACSRLSPVAGFFCGALLVAYAALVYLAPSALNWVPAPAPQNPVRLVSGLTATVCFVAGAAMLVAIAVPTRWVKWRDRSRPPLGTEAPLRYDPEPQPAPTRAFAARSDGGRHPTDDTPTQALGRHDALRDEDAPTQALGRQDALGDADTVSLPAGAYDNRGYADRPVYDDRAYRLDQPTQPLPHSGEHSRD